MAAGDWLELSPDDGPILRALRRRQRELDRQRPTGLHISTLIDDFVACAYPQPEREALAEKHLRGVYEVGTIIEAVIADELRQRAGWVKPAPRKFHGVWYSPDGWAARTRTIDEMKSTRITSRHGLRNVKLVKYQIQIDLYSYVWEAWRQRLHVLFLNGNWTPPFPEPRHYIRRPGRAALRGRYEQVLDHASDRGLLKGRG